MSKYENLSDGISDGFALFYVKNGKLCAVLMNEEEAAYMDMIIGLAFKDSTVKIASIDLDNSIFSQ